MADSFPLQAFRMRTMWSHAGREMDSGFTSPPIVDRRFFRSGKSRLRTDQLFRTLQFRSLGMVALLLPNLGMGRDCFTQAHRRRESGPYHATAVAKARYGKTQS